MMWCKNFCSIIVVMSLLVVGVISRKYIIHWNSKIIPKLKQEFYVEVRMNDWMDIFCPRIIGSRSNTATSEMMFDLYNVSSKHYQNCNVTGQRRLLRCLNPRQEIKLTTKFQRKSPSPIGFVFQPGHSYYYISQPIDSNFHSGCSNDTLRMVINVTKHHTTGSLFRYHAHRKTSLKNQQSPQKIKLALQMGPPTPSSVIADSSHSTAAAFKTSILSTAMLFASLLL